MGLSTEQVHTVRPTLSCARVNKKRAQHYYWDAVDMIRKLLMSGVLVYLGRGAPLQAMVGALMGIFFFVLDISVQPRNQFQMTLVSRAALLVLWLTPMAGLAVQIDTSTSDVLQQRGMAAVLLGLTFAVGLLGFFCAFGYAFIYSVKGLKKVEKRVVRDIHRKRTKPKPPAYPSELSGLADEKEAWTWKKNNAGVDEGTHAEASSTPSPDASLCSLVGGPLTDKCTDSSRDSSSETGVSTGCASDVMLHVSYEDADENAEGEREHKRRRQHLGERLPDGTITV